MYKLIIFSDFSEYFVDVKGPKVNYKLHYWQCTELLLKPPNSTTQAAITTNKNLKMSSFTSSETNQKINHDGPDKSISNNKFLSLPLEELALKAIDVNKPRHEKTGYLHMRKQRRRSASRCREADQCLCFRYIDSTIPLLSKSESSCFQPSSVAVQPGLCQTWSDTPKTGFLTTRLKFSRP